MIDRVHFENFKSLKDTTLDLGRLTVLVGANGCGKSTVLQGIEILSQTAQPRGDEWSHDHRRFHWIFSERREPTRISSPGRPTTMKFSGSRGGDELVVEVVIPASAEKGASTQGVEYRVTLDGPAGRRSAATTAAVENAAQGSSPTPPDAHLTELDALLTNPRVQEFASAAYLHLDPAAMITTSVSHEERPRMAADGFQLPSALAWMKGAAEDELAQVTKSLMRVVPGVKRIRTLREQITGRRFEKLDVDGQPVWRPVKETLVGDRFELEFEDGSSIPADLLSEGTVLALGLLTKLHEPARPRVVLLDDIDRGLHIGAQARLVEVLRDLLSSDPELQIVCTTHSPYLLDRFEPREVRLLALDSERHTRVLALTEHPEFEKWQFGTQTGELWAALGDAWAVASQDAGA